MRTTTVESRPGLATATQSLVAGARSKGCALLYYAVGTGGFEVFMSAAYALAAEQDETLVVVDSLVLKSQWVLLGQVSYPGVQLRFVSPQLAATRPALLLGAAVLAVQSQAIPKTGTARAAITAGLAVAGATFVAVNAGALAATDPVGVRELLPEGSTFGVAHIG